MECIEPKCFNGTTMWLILKNFKKPFENTLVEAISYHDNQEIKFAFFVFQAMIHIHIKYPNHLFIFDCWARVHNQPFLITKLMILYEATKNLLPWQYITIHQVLDKSWCHMYFTVITIGYMSWQSLFPISNGCLIISVIIKLLSIDVQAWAGYQGPLLLTEVRQTSIRIRSWISNYIHAKQWYIISHPYPIFNNDLITIKVRVCMTH